MFAFIIRRFLFAIPIALAVAAVCFSLVHLAPGDPLTAVIPADAPAEVVIAIKEAYGMDRPLIVQFGSWIQRAVQGDLGVSVATGRPVMGDIGLALSNTLTLAFASAFIGFSGGILLGALAAFYNGTWVDKVATAVAITGVSIPHYWLGLLLVIIFSVQLDWLPSMGAGPGGSSNWRWDWAHLQHLVLPAVTMCFIPMGIVTRTVRATVSEILNSEFVVALQARGLRASRITLHVAKNAAPTVLSVMGLQFGYLLGGSILVETVFSWPGTGYLLNTAIFQRDIPLLQGIILVLAMFFVALNLLVDVLQTLMDPRIKRG
ncbi:MULTISPECIES: ABC transporter permease [Nitrincola]|uniref:ABC transporter permease n=2 Tax=Nitrincola TaxID=267849 RepID=A0A364NPX3_9GAMM|nr:MULTISPECIES: ABC transporter permease [Nitrincola]EXJ11046.1 Glutathione transport system permease protein gsiC [Nitrincola nitratireducens]RAU18947.1 ABC transporter permease [Nitrincola tibetensis]